ncbi:hypothetical protein NL676_039622 [Syzygium grande]|nr:hypothetical protein NL676_039622 [Syzygium grande]
MRGGTILRYNRSSRPSNGNESAALEVLIQTAISCQAFRYQSHAGAFSGGEKRTRNCTSGETVGARRNPSRREAACIAQLFGKWTKWSSSARELELQKRHDRGRWMISKTYLQTQTWLLNID